MIKAALLDIDGTFLDSNTAHAEAWVVALQRFDFQRSITEVRKCIGMGGDKLLPHLIGVEGDSDLGKRISKFRDSYFRETYLKALKPFPGARALVKELLKRNIKLVIATSSNAQDLKKLLKQADLVDLLTEAVTSDDVENSKPAPDIVAVALKKSGENAASAVMIGDTPYDLEAAAQIGVKTLAFRSGGWNDQGLKEALAIYDGPADLLNKIETSVFGSKNPTM